MSAPSDSKQLRLVYMGTPDFAVTPLKYLVEHGYNVVGVVTMPDKPAGRGLKMQESAVKQYASGAGLNILQPEKLKAPEFVEAFKALRADLAIVIAFRMLPEVIWRMPRLGTFNLHASLLPQYRGAAPINWAIINGDTETGVTTFMLNNEIDKGDILGQRKIAITPEDNAGTLHDKLMYAGTELVAESIEKIAAGGIELLPQEHIAPEHLRPAPKIFKENCRIDWTQPGEAIRNLIRGLSPYPAAYSNLLPGAAENPGNPGNPRAGAGNGDPISFARPDNAGPQIIPQEAIPVKIYGAGYEKVGPTTGDKGAKETAGIAAETAGHTPGTIVSDDKTYLKVVCKDGLIRIDELQLAGKKRMTTEELLRGFKNITRYRFEV